ncbi:TonB-dependent receptor plug domain-containing protein [Betaproteobacteria bacterium LSUCC0115]|nr:TonB-dependent receptor plug domain-containing protein [Burkholderiales bacterium LSUCC0115]
MNKTKQLPSQNALSVAIALALVNTVAVTPSAWAQTTLPEVRVESTVLGTQAQPLSLLGSFFQGNWLDQPVSATTIDEDAIKNSGSSRLTDLLRLDSSVDPNYSPIGYYENFQIRGFPVDPVLGMRVNGVPFVGEAPISMDNKQRVEVLRGPAGALVGMGSSGGLINLLTKRPDNIREAGLRVEQRESLGLTADIGVADGSGQGWRLNASADRYRPYAKGADGEGAMVSLAMDQRLSGGDSLQVDVEIAHKSQITQPGSQLLGGTTLAPINPVTVLGLSSWSQPVTFDSIFAMARLQKKLQSGWKMTATGSVHHVKTDDRSSFPFGYSTAEYANYGTQAYYRFSSDGKFSMYDYRSLDEVRETDFLEADFKRVLNSGGFDHTLRTAISLTRRYFSMPNYRWNDAAPFPSYGNVLSGTWSGDENPDQYPAKDAYGRTIYVSQLSLSDQITFPSKWQVTASGRVINYQDDATVNFLYRTGDFSRSMTSLLPDLRVQRKLGTETAYWFGYSSDLEAASLAPQSSQNHLDSASTSEMLLKPRKVETLDLAYKWEQPGVRMMATMFHAWRPFNFRNDASLADSQAVGDYIQRGTESRTGLELSLSGALTKRTDAQISATLMTSDTSGTGNPLFEGKEALNTPKFRLNTFVNYRVPGIEGLSASANWLYTGKRPASRDNSVYAPDFHRLDLGLSYVQKTKAGAATYRLAIENVTDERCWRDVAEFLGDAYLTPGAPRLVKASATVSF